MGHSVSSVRQEPPFRQTGSRKNKNARTISGPGVVYRSVGAGCYILADAAQAPIETDF
jgi:hypothetical protein